MTILPGKARPSGPPDALQRPGRRESWNVDDFLSVGRLQNFAYVALCIEFIVRAYIVHLPYLVGPPQFPEKKDMTDLLAPGVVGLRVGVRSAGQAKPDLPPPPRRDGQDSVVAAGFVAGLVGWNALPVRWGRRWPAVAGTLLFSVAFWLQNLSPVHRVAWALRFLTGAGMGQLTFVWILELVRTEKRAVVVTWAAGGWAVGGLLAVAAAVVLGDSRTDLVAVLPTLPIVLSLLIYTILCPESPQVMALHYSHEAATHVMQRIARINKTLADYTALPEHVFSRRRPYGSALAELMATLRYDVLTLLTFAMTGALLCAARRLLLASLRDWPSYYALLTSAACAFATLTVMWGSAVMGRKPLLSLCLLGAAACVVLRDLQPLVPEVLATIALGFLVAALVTLTLTTAEGYPTTSRALGLCLGGLAVISGATGFAALVKDPEVAFVTTTTVLGVHFILTLCRRETAGLAPRLRVSDFAEDAQQDDEETQYLLPRP